MHYRKSGCAINKREWVGIKCTQVDSLRNKRLVKPDFLSCFCLFSISHKFSISMSSAIKWRLVPIYISRRSHSALSSYISNRDHRVLLHRSVALSVVAREKCTTKKCLPMALLFGTLSQFLVVQYRAEIKLRMVFTQSALCLTCLWPALNSGDNVVERLVVNDTLVF